MKTITEKIIITFAIISIITGVVQIVLGQTEYNSIIVGFGNAYLYFTVGIIMLGTSKIIGLLYDIRNKIDK